MGIHEDNRYRSESKKQTLKSVEILGLGSGPELEKKLKYAEDVSSGIIFGRELVNSPANVLTPGSYEICRYLLLFLLYCAIICWMIYALILTGIQSGLTYTVAMSFLEHYSNNLCC